MYYRVYKSIETQGKILSYSKGDACLACPNALPNSGGSAGPTGLEPATSALTGLRSNRTELRSQNSA